MRKMRLNLDELVVEAFTTTRSGSAARGTVRGHSGALGCEPTPGNEFDVEPDTAVDIHSRTGAIDFCACPEFAADSSNGC